MAALVLAGQSLQAHQPHDPMVTVAVSPNYAQDQTVFAATDALTIKIGVYALLKSTNGGVTWSVVAGLPSNTRMAAIVLSPAYSQDQTIFIGGNGGLFRTTNQGASWNLLEKVPLVSVALSPNFASDGTLFAVATTRTILKSTTRGQSWTNLPAPPSLTSNLNAIAVSPNYAVDNTLLLGSKADGIFRSTDGGASWVQVATQLPAVTALAFAPSFSSDHTAFAATFGSGVLVSMNGGGSWTSSNSGITDLNVSSLALSPGYLQDATLWITTAAGGVFQSNTRGASWTPGAKISRRFSALTTTHYQAVAPASGGSGAVLFLAMYEGLWTSSNGAASWQYVDTIPTRLIRYINLSPNYAQDQTVFVSTYGGGNSWSTTGGATWTIQNTGMQSSYTDASGISPNFAVDNTAFSSMDNGLQRSTDRGATWQVMQALGAVTYPRGLAVSPNFAQDSTVLIGTDNGDGLNYPPFVMYQGQQYPNQGLFLSTDGGNNWVPTTLGGPPVISIAVSPAFATDRTAFAASPVNGLYKSSDGGMTWTLLTLPGKTKQMAKVAVTPSFARDQTVFAAAVVGGGIYKSTDAGSTWSLLPGTNALRVLDLEVSPDYATDQSFFAGTIQKGLLKFKSGGTSIVPIILPDTLVTAVAISPNLAKDGTLYAAGYHGLYKSTNGGSTWTYLAVPARIEESRQANSAYAPQNPPTIVYQGNWSGINPSAVASTNAYMVTSESQDTAVLNFTGSGVRWVSWIGPAQGSASIQLDGVSEGTVSLTAPVDQYQQTVWEQHGILCGLHTFTITAAPQPGQTVSLDAFDVWVDTCPTDSKKPG